MRPGELVEITVSEENILCGVRQSRSCCPVALALQDADYSEVNVGNVMAFFSDEGERIKLRLPEIAAQFIRDFDMGRLVQPVTFTATVME